ncbi:hypothetical protein RUND412_006818 [Rhizina undulata]
MEEDIGASRTYLGLAATLDMRITCESRFVRARTLLKTLNARKQEIRCKDKEFREQRGKLMEGTTMSKELEISEDKDENWEGLRAGDQEAAVGVYEPAVDDETDETAFKY